MKVYNVKYSVFGSEKLGNITDKIDVVAPNFLDAIIEATTWISRETNTEDIIIHKVEEYEKINVVNLDESDCTCPFCSFEDAEEDKRITFVHSTCNNQISVADDGWTTLECPFCHNEFYRSFLSKTVEGMWIYDEGKKSSSDK